MRIAGCYIVKNEEGNIGESIKSMFDAIDELVVVDTGSTDRTVEVVKKYNAKIYHYEWNNNFSEARNFALEKVDSPWIIFLDADEFFCHPFDVHDAILEKINEVHDLDAIMVTRYNIDALDKNLHLPSDVSIRILRNSTELRYRGVVHENLCNINSELKITYGDERLALWHTGYSQVGSREKIIRNMKLISADMAVNGEQPWHDLYLAIHYFGLRIYDRALQFAITALASDLSLIGGRGQLYHIAIESMRQLGIDYEDMLLLIQAAINELPQLPEFYAEKGMVLSALGKLDEAESLFKRSLKLYTENSARYRYDSYYSTEVANIVKSRLNEIDNIKRYSRIFSNSEELHN